MSASIPVMENLPEPLQIAVVAAVIIGVAAGSLAGAINLGRHIGLNGWPTRYNLSADYEAGWKHSVWGVEPKDLIRGRAGREWQAGVKAGERYVGRHPHGVIGTPKGQREVQNAMLEATAAGDTRSARELRKLIVPVDRS